MGRWLVEQSFQGSLKFRRRQMNYLFAFCFCSLLRLGRVGGMKQVPGVLGENVLLKSGNSADLHGREVVWEFTSNNGTEFTILDVGPNHPEVKPNKYFEDRLNFNLSTGDLLLSNLKTSDQGNYTISIDGREPRKRELRIFDKLSQVSIRRSSSSCLYSTIRLNCRATGSPDAYRWWKDGGEIPQHHQLLDQNRQLVIPNASEGDHGIYTCVASNPVSMVQKNYTLVIYGHSAYDTLMVVLSISALVFSSLFLIAVFSLNIWKIKSNEELPKYKRWKYVLCICNILQLVFILAAFSHSIHFKGSGFPNVATACIAVLLLFTSTVPFITQVSKCQRIRRFSTSIDIWNFIQCALHVIMIGISFAFFIKDIHQEKQGCTFHTWNVLIASVAECTVSFIMAFIFYSSLHSPICLWVQRGYSWMTGRNKSNTNEKGPQNAEELQSFTTFTTEDAGSVHSN